MNYSDVIVIVTILALSIYLSFVTAMFWDFTHDSHSYGILILSCASAALGNTSVMVFFSYATTCLIYDRTCVMQTDAPQTLQ